VQDSPDHIDTRRVTKFSLVDIPTVTWIRERAVQAFLSRNPSSTNAKGKKCVSITDTWNFIMNSGSEAHTDEALVTDQYKSPLRIEVSLAYSQDRNECIEFLRRYGRSTIDFDLIMGAHSITLKKMVRYVLDSMTNSELQEFAAEVLTKPTVPVHSEHITFRRDSILIAGRYNKFSRRLCQTPWIIQGSQRMDGSVQDLICGSIADQLGTK
ncbi:hypothetical protein QAD02_002430, partial [Eretmocerus hayati]